MKKQHFGIILLLCFLGIQAVISCAPVLFKNSDVTSDIFYDSDDSEDLDDHQEDEDEWNKSFPKDDFEMLQTEGVRFVTFLKIQKSIYFYFLLELNSAISTHFCPPELV